MGSLLADQQNKQGNQNTDDERNNPMPPGLDLFRSSAFLRRFGGHPSEQSPPLASPRMANRRKACAKSLRKASMDISRRAIPMIAKASGKRPPAVCTENWIRLDAR